MAPPESWILRENFSAKSKACLTNGFKISRVKHIVLVLLCFLRPDEKVGY